MPHARVARTRAQQSARARPADQPGCLKACTRQMHAEGSKRVHGAALLCPLSLGAHRAARQLIEAVMKANLGWLVVWGNVFGGIIGVISEAAGY